MLIVCLYKATGSSWFSHFHLCFLCSVYSFPFLMSPLNPLSFHFHSVSSFFLLALLVRVVPPPSSFTGDDDDNDNFIYKQCLEAQTAPEVNSSELPQCLCFYFVGATGRPVLISSEAFNHIPVIRWDLQSTQIVI